MGMVVCVCVCVCLAADESDVYDSDDGYKSDGPSVRLAPDEHPTSDPKEQGKPSRVTSDRTEGCVCMQ